MNRMLLTAMALVIALAACSSSKKVYSSGGTTVTTDTSQKTVTVQSSEGTMKMGQGVVDVASLGVPIYAGATQDDGALSVSGSKGSAQMAAFTTGDPFDKVYGFYHTKMPAGSEKMKVDEGDSSMAEFVLGTGKAGQLQTMVMISKKGDKTSIVITKGTQGQ
jgi:ABC-type enterochelin transport system substrate-binding protein